MPQKMSQAEFIKRLKEEMPELKDFSDFDIIKGISQRRPDILEKVEGPNETRARADAANAKGQAKAEQGSHFFSNVSPDSNAYSPLGASAKSLWEYAKGATIDIPSSIIHGVPSAVQSFVDIANPARYANKALDAIDSVSQLKKMYEQAGTDPGTFGRTLGQITGQPIVTEGLVGNIPIVNKAAGTLVKPAQAGVRAAGRTMSTVGSGTHEIARIIPPYTIPRLLRYKAMAGGIGLEKIGNRLAQVGLTPEEFNANALNQFWGGSKPGPVSAPAPTISTPEMDLVDKMLAEARAGSKTKSGNINELSRQFREKLPEGTDLGFKPGTTEQPQLPFGDTPSGGGPWQGPSGPDTPPPFKPSGPRLPLEGTQEGLKEEIGKIAAGKNSVIVTNPNANKIRILQEQGFKVTGPANTEGGPITMTRERTTPAKPKVKKPKDTGEGELVVDPETGGFKWQKKGQVGGKEPGPSTASDTGGPKGEGPSEDWKKTYTNLRQMLGRDPSAAEIEAAQARVPKEGEKTGQVTAFPPKFDNPAREWYQLPDGRIIPVDSTATKGVKSFDFPLKDGTMVKATRIEQPEIEPHGMYGPEYKANPRTNATDKFGPKPEIPPPDKWDMPELNDSNKLREFLSYDLDPEIRRIIEARIRQLGGEVPPTNEAPFPNKPYQGWDWEQSQGKSGQLPPDKSGQLPPDIDMTQWPPKTGPYQFPVRQPGVESQPGLFNSPIEATSPTRTPSLGAQPPDPSIQRNFQFEPPVQNDVLGVRQQSVLGPAGPQHTPTPPRMGQQELPLGPHLPSPQLDEYGVPQNRDWSQEDIFRINHEMKNAQMDFPPGARPAIPPPPLLDAEQMNIPEIGDAEIQNYLGNEDATPPEMVDLPKHSPDKISFMQKLKDMLDQEEYA